MAEIAFACPSCGQHLEAPGELAGENVECPSCEATITVPAAVTTDAAPAAAETASSNCPSCGSEMPEGAVLCTACGYHTTLGKKIETSFE